MKFLVCIFLSFFCVFAQASPSLYGFFFGSRPKQFLSLDSLIDSVTNKGMDSRTLLKLAEQGDTDAQIELAGVYLRAHYTKEDTAKSSGELKQSLYWFEKAAKQGNPEAQTILGTIYCCSDSWNFRAKGGFFFKSRLVEKDWVEAFRWFKKASDQRYPEAQYRVANMSVSGTVVEKNTARGIALLKTLAANGNEDAQVDLFAITVFEGHYRSDNEIIKGANLIKQIAQKGNVRAQIILGSLYVVGDDREARKQNFPTHLFPVDYNKAVYWLKKALDQEGGEPAVVVLSTLEKEGKIILDSKTKQKVEEFRLKMERLTNTINGVLFLITGDKEHITGNKN